MRSRSLLCLRQADSKLSPSPRQAQSVPPASLWPSRLRGTHSVLLPGQRYGKIRGTEPAMSLTGLEVARELHPEFDRTASH